MTNLDNILKSKDITLPTKVRIFKTIFFFFSPVVMQVRKQQLELDMEQQTGSK